MKAVGSFETLVYQSTQLFCYGKEGYFIKHNFLRETKVTVYLYAIIYFTTYYIMRHKKKTQKLSN
jgi:hypothetical protein